VSLLGVMALTAGYEAVREASRRYEQRHAVVMEDMPRKFSFVYFPPKTRRPRRAAGLFLLLFGEKPIRANAAHSCCGQAMLLGRRSGRARW